MPIEKIKLIGIFQKSKKNNPQKKLNHLKGADSKLIVNCESFYKFAIFQLKRYTTLFLLS